MFSLLLTTLLITAAPAEVRVEPLAFDINALKQRPRVELKVKEGDATVTYSGVPLAVVLEGQFKSARRMADLRALGDAVILIRGSDGYQAALGAAEAATDPKGERYLIAFERDGKPLDAKQGPAKLIIPAEAEHVRWVRMIDSLTLVRLSDLKPTPKS
ncbi:molybdopterin-dependent oxidoreductase [Isosphaeraceae bacterium EP7]